MLKQDTVLQYNAQNIQKWLKSTPKWFIFFPICRTPSGCRALNICLVLLTPQASSGNAVCIKIKWQETECSLKDCDMNTVIRMTGSLTTIQNDKTLQIRLQMFVFLNGQYSYHIRRCLKRQKDGYEHDFLIIIHYCQQ